MNKLPPWTHVSRPHHAGVRPFLCGMLAGIALVALPWERMFLRLANLAGNARCRGMERKALAPMVEEACRIKLSYDRVAAGPEDFVGKHVLWCVDHPARGVSYLNGRPSQPLAWINEDAVPLNSPMAGGRCTKVIAAVEGADAQGVQLRYIGLP